MAADGADTRFGSWVQGQLDATRDAGQWRTLRTFDAFGPVGRLEGQRVVSFASNDYLGLSSHPQLIAAAHEALDRWGTGATASRLVVGSRPIHDELEQRVAAWKKTERALVFPSGFSANLGVLSALGGPDCHVVSDELNHASIIDGCRLSRARVSINRHNDAEHVETLLRDAGPMRSMVVADAVFSMDGDVAPVNDLADICARHGALLVLDEAHSVLGPDIDELAALPGLELLRVATLSKGLGALGAAVCGSNAIIDLLINRARSFIFTTGLTPADTAAASAAVEIMTSQVGQQLTDRLRTLANRMIVGHPSPILPLIIGAEADAIDAAKALLDRGLLVPAIRPPTVAPGTSRLRVALSAAHTDDQIALLVETLDELQLRP
jgi:8-amino-7-oxononanoate synthase